MTWALILFLIGLIGFILNRKNVILMLVSIEIMLLSITLIILINSIAFNDNLGQHYFMLIENYSMVYPFYFIFKLKQQVNSFTTSSNSYFNNLIVPNINLIDPNYITGFTDGEGCFYFSIVENSNKIGWRVKIGFTLVASNNPANLIMLKNVRDFFGVGIVKVTSNPNVLVYLVENFKDCLILREHFLNYPLLTYKSVHFLIWCEILKLIENKEHLNINGLLKIIAYKEHAPRGLSTKLRKAFPDFTPINNFEYLPNFSLLNIHWIAGFINADGSFGIYFQKSLTHKLKEQCSPKISISQHNRSILVLNAIIVFLGMGKLINKSNENASDLVIYNLSDINKFIELFSEAQLLGAKALDYADFIKGIELINTKQHLTRKGLNSLKGISNNMNLKRTKFE